MWNPENYRKPEAAQAAFARRVQRDQRSMEKMEAMDRIPFFGVRYGKGIAKNHRYLRAHRLPHSRTAARIPA